MSCLLVQTLAINDVSAMAWQELRCCLDGLGLEIWICVGLVMMSDLHSDVEYPASELSGQG